MGFGKEMALGGPENAGEQAAGGLLHLDGDGGGEMAGKDGVGALEGIGIVNDVADGDIVQHEDGGFFAVEDELIRIAFGLDDLDLAGIEAVEVLGAAPDAGPVEREGLVGGVEIQGEVGFLLNAGEGENLPDGVVEGFVLQGVDLVFQEEEAVVFGGFDLRSGDLAVELGLHPTSRGSDGEAGIIGGGVDGGGEDGRATD